jgi:hypothetical protein
MFYTSINNQDLNQNMFEEKSKEIKLMDKHNFYN